MDDLMPLIEALQPISDSLASIESILRESHEASQLVQQEAMTVLEAHKESAQQYIQNIEQPEPVNSFPFKELPAGTSVRALPDGGHSFQFANGENVVFNQEGSIVATSTSGTTSILRPTRGGKVMTPDGRALELVAEALRFAHDSSGIEGLPPGVMPIKVAETRYRIDLPSGVRIDVEQQRKIVMVCDVSGSILAIGINKTEGYAEEVEVRLLDNGSKDFQAKETGHKGMVEADGTIHLSLAQGDDLIFRFPRAADDRP